jgi:non-ribosomal peptide synthetase component F
MSDSTQWVGEIPADKLDLLIRKIQQKKAAAPQGPRLARRERPEETAPLSFGQQQLWFMEQMDLGAAVYNLPAAIRCDGELRVDVLERALAEILRRHEALRTRFAVMDGRPAQQPVAVETQGPVLAFHDLSGLPAAERETEAARRAEAEARERFDLGAGRLLRATLLRLKPRRHLLLLTVHHLGADAWSVGLLLRELATLYTAFAEGNPSPLPEPAVQYADFALWQRERLQGATLDGLVGWWRERLGERPAGFEVPPDFPRPPVQTYAGARVPVAIGAAAAEALRRLGRESGTSLFATVLAVWNALLARWSGRDEVVLGTAAAQRPDLALEGLIGLFINTVVLRTDLAGDPSFRTLLERSRETALGAFSHAELPFQQLVEALQPERDLSRGPLFQIFFALQESGLPTLELPELTLRPSESYGGATEYDLALSLSESAEGITGSLDYNVDLYEEATVRRLADRLAAFCDAVAADPGRRLSDLPLLSGEDARQVELWSQASSGDLPAVDATLPELFAAQAERRPEAVAAVHHEESLTYRELAARAAALAGHLRGLGIRPGDRVGVCADRSLPMLVSLLGVLETGAAYVPLDPAYPQARLAGMLADAEAAALVIHGPRAETLAGTFTGPIVQASATPALSPVPSRPSFPPETPAYLLYTSGSTGAPKGVMVTHRNVAGFFAAMDQALADDPEVWPGVWLAVTSISFDISVLELLWTLTRGWKVVVQDETATWLAAAPRTVARPIDFSLFYFADAAGDAREKYRLLLEGARFADEHGFQAVWTPERHFHAFGGLYPNPSVTGAAVAATTRRIAIRAGSVVLPLHDPLRVAEEWAVVDNISGGRVGVSFASGWHADDFVFAPDRYADRKEAMLDGIETVRALWRGEAVRRRGGSGGEVEVRVLPRPLQPRSAPMCSPTCSARPWRSWRRRSPSSAPPGARPATSPRGARARSP